MAQCQRDRLSPTHIPIENLVIEDKKKDVPRPLNYANTPFSDVVYRELAKINGEINKMSKARVLERMKSLGLSTDGTCEVLRKRLKNYYKKKKLSKKNLLATSKLYPYYVVIDFEATCQEINGPDFPHEIIEFPAVLVSTDQQVIVDEFQSYCKPVLAPILTDFCVELTGITQQQVDAAEPFPVVLTNFEKWLRKHKLGLRHKYAFVTDGPWDMGRFLDGQCIISELPYPAYARKWINLRKSFSNFYKSKRYCLEIMLSHLGMEFVGRPHCGLDDARNIALVLLRMLSDGATVQFNEKICWNKRECKQGKVIPVQPREKLRDVEKVRRERSKMKDHSIFELSDTDVDEEKSSTADKDVEKEKKNSETE